MSGKRYASAARPSRRRPSCSRALHRPAEQAPAPASNKTWRTPAQPRPIGYRPAMPPHKHGAHPIDPSLRRSERLTLMVRPGELDDLRALAAGWDVSVSAAGWALLADLLAELRSQPPAIGTTGALLLAASRRVLARAGDG